MQISNWRQEVQSKHLCIAVGPGLSQLTQEPNQSSFQLLKLALKNSAWVSILLLSMKHLFGTILISHILTPSKLFPIYYYHYFPYIDSLQIVSHIFPPSKWLAMLKLIAEWTELFPEVPSGGFLHLRPMQPNVKINLQQFRPEAETVLYVFFTEKFSFWDLESAELWWMWTICVEPISKYKCSCFFSLSPSWFPIQPIQINTLNTDSPTSQLKKTQNLRVVGNQIPCGSPYGAF